MAPVLLHRFMVFVAQLGREMKTNHEETKGAKISLRSFSAPFVSSWLVPVLWVSSGGARRQKPYHHITSIIFVICLLPFDSLSSQFTVQFTGYGHCSQYSHICR